MYFEDYDQDKCQFCNNLYNAADWVKWWLCWYEDCDKNQEKRPRCSECIVRYCFVEKAWNWQCKCSKKILEESAVLSVEEFNQLDSRYKWEKDSVKQ